MDIQNNPTATSDAASTHHDDCDGKEDDGQSVVSSNVSDRDTLALFPPDSRPMTPEVKNEDRGLGLSTIGLPPFHAEFDVVTVHGLRDDHKHVWKLDDGSPWLQTKLLGDVPIRQIDYMYAADDNAHIFEPNGIKLEAQNLLRLYVENRRMLPTWEMDRRIIWVCHDVGGAIVKQVLLEASKPTLREELNDVETSQYTREVRNSIASLSGTILFLGCPHLTESTEVLEDELHNLMALPGPHIETGLTRKIRNLALQMQDINIRFLDGKFLSRLVYINAFALKILQIDDKMRTVKDAILEPTMQHTLSSEVDMDIKHDGNDRDISNTDTLEAMEESQGSPGHALSDGNSEIGAFCQSNVDQAGIQEQYAAKLHPEKETAICGQISQMSPLNFPVVHASPFSRYTLRIWTMYSNFYRDGECDHAALARGDKYVENVNGWLRDFREDLDVDRDRLGTSPEFVNKQLALLYLAPSAKLPVVHSDPELFDIPFLNWIFNHERFQDFETSAGPYTLCIQGAEEDMSRMAMVSQHVCIRYDNKNCLRGPPGVTQQRSTFYFQFDEYDSKRNSIKAMLAMFLTEVTWHMWSKPAEAAATRQMFRSFETYCNWSLPFLFQVFMELRRSARTENFTIFLSCFDKCIEDERVWFVRNVLNHQRRCDNRFRLIITTCRQDVFLNQCLPTAHVISLEKCPAPLTGYAIDEKGYSPDGLKTYLEDILLKRQVFTRLRSGLEGMIANYQRVPYLGYRVLDWLRSFGRGIPTTEVATVIDKLDSATPQNVLSTIVQSTLPHERNKALAIYQWVRNAMEPMTLEALGQALAVSMTPRAPLLDIDFDQLLQDMTRLFSGIVVIEGLYVRFSHESFYSTDISCVDGGHEDLSVAHGVLAEACLKYLMHEEVQPEYARISVDSYGGDVLKTPLLPRHDFLEYAVRFWADHYRLCYPFSQPTTLALRFFHNTGARNKWAEAHYLLSNPFTRIHRGYFSSLPLTAALGLEDILSRQLEDDGNSEWSTTDAWLAIVEATRSGHNSIVHRLLQRVPLQESRLKDALAWAACADNKVALASFLEKITLLESFSWPSALVFQAVSLGHDSLVSACLRAEDHLEEEANLWDMALHEAIAWGQQAVVKLLLESKVNLSFRDDLGRTALLLSARFGQPEIVQMLLDAGASIHDEDNEGSSAIDTAISFGQHQALARLLEARARSEAAKGEEDAFDIQAHLTRASDLGKLQCARVIFENADHFDGGSNIDELLYAICGVAHTAHICRGLIERGAKPHQLHSDKGVLLHRALKTGDKKLIRLLVEQGAELKYTDEHNDGTTPLSFAIRECSLDIVEFLLESGAPANYVPENADSVLFIACYEAIDIGKVKLLLKHGAKVDWNKDDGWTALHGAYDLPEHVSLLLDHGADVNAMSSHGTPLMMAARWNYVDVLKRLLAHPATEVNAKFNYDSGDSQIRGTALFQAVEEGSHECVNILIAAGAEIDGGFESAKFLLESAKLDGSEECLKMVRNFMDRKTRIDFIDNGNTTLHGVNTTTPTWVLQYMAERGALIDSPNHEGLTPLGVAVEKGNVAAAEYFISKGARVNVCGPRFGSLLHLACQVDQPEEIRFRLFKMLIDAHADPNLPGPESSKESVLHQVCRDMNSGMQERVITYLIRNSRPKLDINARGGPHNYPIMAAAYFGKRKILEYLVRHGADVNVYDDLGRHTVHYVSGRARWYYIMRPLQILAKFGANLMVKDHFGRTALHFIAGSDDIDLLEFFLKRLPNGHDINLRDEDGWTPLMWACRTSDPTMVIESLVKNYGADIWAKSFDGEWSAMKLACLSNQSEESKSLLQPPEHEREREAPDGSKQTWDPAFHSISPGKQDDSYSFCNSCFAIMVGTRHKCMICDDYDLCFKCYPQRSAMHDEYHDFGEYFDYKFQDEIDPSEDGGSAADVSQSSDKASARGDPLDANGDDEGPDVSNDWNHEGSEAEYSDT